MDFKEYFRIKNLLKTPPFGKERRKSFLQGFFVDRQVFWCNMLKTE
jgi:hypothetical protein